GDGAGRIRVGKLHGHDLDVPVDTGGAHGVVPHHADGAGDMGAVPVVVHRVAVPVDEVVAVVVVNEAIAVVVGVVAGDLPRVMPHVGGQVRVRVVHPGVEDGDDDAAAPGGDVPGLVGVDVGVGRAGGLPSVEEAPVARQGGVVRHPGAAQDDIGLGVQD